MSALAQVRAALWPSPDDRHGPLVPLLVTLTLVTGVVDATSYLMLGHVFVANMTGNVVFLGFALAGAGGLSAPASLIALAAFIAGAFGGGWLGVREAAHRGRVLRTANIAQASLMALSLLIALLCASPPDRAVRYGLIASLALAMGIQNAAAQRLSVPDLTTTVLTKTLTGLASEGGGRAEAGPSLIRRSVSIGAMLAGAVVGGLLVLDVSIAASIAVALGLVLSVGLSAHLVSHAHPDAAWTHP